MFRPNPTIRNPKEIGFASLVFFSPFPPRNFFNHFCPSPVVVVVVVEGGEGEIMAISGIFAYILPGTKQT